MLQEQEVVAPEIDRIYNGWMKNPYQSAASSAPEVTRPARKRPLSVWLLLLVLGGLMTFHTIVTISIAGFMASHQPQEPIFLVANIAGRLGILALGGGILLAIVRRRQWARWLGVLVMGVLTFALFFIPDTTQYANDIQRSAGFVIRTILTPALMVWWRCAFGFSSKARRYFAN
ncbi:hypothetical protein [Massilia genomosp. 1]|uniref:hypothetical protein n=1 Tax=Massilia genomosp. 1 TaxID=2609280 RepID=UPI001C9E9573|nr:hypothetical protein [Massilia genomosp. 1]